ncbi:MAG: response regulator transcription factor [Phycisphaerae bacterium]|jgi:DNA-binding NarL/FixJ family response regulator|nr:response regulator transcription factor [Phycisphaerae bacterium]MCZ2399688.1 response regulator transcription factor [Phycisphaerae bacterium]NUQ48649.1 response regulator transcription factor [Phycisphaerae bacterium]
MDARKPVAYLMAASELDRRAYRLLLQHELQTEPAVDSGFAPVSVWAGMRARPEVVVAVADHASGEIRDALQMIPVLQKATRVVVVSASVEPAALRAWGQCPFSAYVVKDGGVDELRRAMTAVMANECYYSPGVQSAIEAGRTQGNHRAALSRREAELLPLLASGLSLRDAAARLMVSYKTADSYRTTLLRKLGVRDRVELTLYAIREGIIEP